MLGKVKQYNTKKRFGYIEGDDGEVYFVHESEIKTPSNSLEPGYMVQFGVTGGFPKKQAFNVRFL